MLRHPLFRFFSSLKLAVVVILSLSTVLAVATVAESLYGTRSSYVMIYGRGWFAGLLALLGLNVLCAALSRFPWKKHQTGFVVTHAGILTLLIGSWVTQKYGVDGNLPVYEGQTDNEVVLNDLSVRVAEAQGKVQNDFKVTEHPWRKTGDLMEIDLGAGRKLVAVEYLPRLVYEKTWEPSGIAGLGAPAIEIELFNSRFRVQEWLHVKEAENPAEINFGPASVRLEKFWNKEGEEKFSHDLVAKKAKLPSLGYVQVQHGGKTFRVAFEDGVRDWQKLGRAGFEVKIEKYFPYAVVENNQLINKGNEPLNPAAHILVRSPSGEQEKHTIFTNFPEFATLHQKELPKGHKPFGVRLSLILTTGKNVEAPTGQGELRFAQSADDKTLFYRSKGKAGDLKAQGAIKVGEATPTGWMDLQFTVKRWIPNAIEVEKPRYIPQISGTESNFLSGLRFEVRSDKARATASEEANHEFWLTEGASRTLALDGRDYLITYGKEKLPLPFVVFLDKFTMGTNPGTDKAATYESNVTVIDDQQSVRKSALISMNEPLVYAGYTLYQASYNLEEGKPPLSVFSVNRDAGRWVKYLGSILIVLGAALMFWMNPHYWSILLGGAKTRKDK